MAKEIHPTTSNLFGNIIITRPTELARLCTHGIEAWHLALPTKWALQMVLNFQATGGICVPLSHDFHTQLGHTLPV